VFEAVIPVKYNKLYSSENNSGKKKKNTHNACTHTNKQPQVVIVKRINSNKGILDL